MNLRSSRSPLLPLGLFAAGCLAVSGCVIVSASTDDGHGNDAHDEREQGPSAMAVVESKSGSGLAGSATFHEVAGGVRVTLEVSGTEPGWHAVHIHEKGDCSSEDGKSAGGHFNPAAVDHGSPHAEVHHAGDLGNMFVREDGSGLHEIFMPGLTVEPGDNSVVGRAIIVHAGADDLVSQPTGAAGGRIGCGVIR